jgi:hypothetical protein
MSTTHPIEAVWSDWAVFVSSPNTPRAFANPSAWRAECGHCGAPCGLGYAWNSETNLVLCPWCAASIGVAPLDAFAYYPDERRA